VILLGIFTGIPAAIWYAFGILATVLIAYLLDKAHMLDWLWNYQADKNKAGLEEIEDDANYPLHIDLDGEIWNIARRTLLKRDLIKKVLHWRFELNSEDTGASDIRDVTTSNMKVDLTDMAFWNNKGAVLTYNPNSEETIKDTEISRWKGEADRLRKECKSLKEKVSELSADVDVQIERRIKQRGLASRAGTSYGKGKPYSDRDEDRDNEDYDV
jgi:hypothetical protein